MKDLSTLIYEAKHKDGQRCLTEAEQDSLYILLVKGCRAKTRAKLVRKVALPLALWEDFGIYRRVELDAGVFYYCAGQSYTDEIRTVRDLILDI
jgi:hypothetical protein